MFARVLKIFGIVALCAVFIFAAVEIWVYRNREKIFRSVQEIVNENLNGNLEIGDFKFRPFYGGLGLNFTLSKVRLTDSLYSSHNKPFLEAELVHVALDLKGFYKGNVKVKNLVLQDGSLNMFTMRNGYSNLTIFQSGGKKKKDKKAGSSNIIEKFGNLRFVNFEVAFADSVKKKYYGALFHDATNIVTPTDTTTNASFAGSVLFKGLTFKPEKGGFLINQETNLALALAFDADAKKLRIYPSVLESATHDKIGITGDFDFADTVRNFRMNFTADKIEVKNALPLLTERLRKQIDSLGIKAKVDTEVKVIGQLMSKNKARVDVKFETDTFNYELPVGFLRQMKAFGTFTNQADTSHLPDIWNSALVAPKVTGLFEKIPFTFKFSVKDFRNPRAILDGRVDADSTNLGALLDESRYKFKRGTAKIDFHFNGSLKNFYNSERDRFDGKIFGKASIKNIELDYLPRKVRLSRITGDFNFNEKAVVFQDLHFYDGQNMLYMRGQILDLIPYLFGSPKPLRAKVNVNIPKWKLNWLEGLFAARQNESQQRRKKRKLSELLDNAIDKMEVTAKLDAKELQYRQFTARDVKGEFTIKDNAVAIEYFIMKAFGKGNFRVSGVMENSGKGQPRVAVTGKVSNADVHSVFRSFDNFGQKTITSDNLKGILNTDFKFEANLNNNVRLMPATMKGELNFDLTRGYIINFEPFMKIKKLIFKKRNFEEVRFAPIRNNIRLRGQEIEIAPMEIESNVLTLYLDGVYSFGNKTDINIQIPLSNLKKRDSTYVLDPNNEEKKGGSKIFLRAIDENGEVNIKLAFRRKREKNKEKNEEVKVDPAAIEK
ncbi:AsmA family protein [Dyadobacter aurulentus]|uniref:AsmA-like C-terminal region-containing protein n=1 Tax=Dyadobacter sp. UC 10 TaxID=2605428 RepID=UPI0011F28DF3|nr:AsmA-like C-terminal region-containing protein [Dyadobacter sp. UC 10]KAA0990425.1 hypothetical protein FXO21_09780 [Dyadobacter sp. UC 10]